MLFIALLTPRQGSSAKDRLAWRQQWKPLDGLKVVSEYWASDSRIIIVFETDNAGVVFKSTFSASDLFDMTVSPVITAEEGLAAL